MKIQKSILSILFLLTAGILASCQGNQPQKAEKNAEQPEINKAICVLYPTEGNNVSGEVVFTETDSGMLVVAEVTGLTEGKHGFHIHEYGDCSKPDGTSAGGHFNPWNKPHGAPWDKERHVGDLGNIVAAAGDTARLELVDTLLSFNGKNSIIGRGIIVHAGEDDLKTQPTGNAGARVACGVIGVEK